MTRYRKKFITFFVAVALVSGGLLALSVRSATEENSTFKAALHQLSGAGRTESHPGVYARHAGSIGAGLFANDPNFSTNPTRRTAAQELFFKTMFAVLLVVVFGIAAMYFSRKLLPRITNLPGRQIHILETAHLGPRKAIHLIEIGDPTSQEPNQRFLIGSTNENISLLAHLGSAAAETLSELSSPEVENSVGSRKAGSLRI